MTGAHVFLSEAEIAFSGETERDSRWIEYFKKIAVVQEFI
jgi:hypothetical protein